MTDQKQSWIIKRSAPQISGIKRAQARQLRNDQTKQEYRLWYVLRGKKMGVKFRRQQVIGPYIVDFYCPELKLVVEADGGQHTPERDEVRGNFLRAEGLHVLRFWNNEIDENIVGVAIKIEEVVKHLKFVKGSS